MKKYPRIFKVKKDKKEGTCYSWHDHFDVIFDDGEYIKTIELSLHNIRKVRQSSLAT